MSSIGELLSQGLPATGKMTVLKTKVFDRAVKRMYQGYAYILPGWKV